MVSFRFSDCWNVEGNVLTLILVQKPFLMLAMSSDGGRRRPKTILRGISSRRRRLLLLLSKVGHVSRGWRVGNVGSSLVVHFRQYRNNSGHIHYIHNSVRLRRGL